MSEKITDKIVTLETLLTKVKAWKNSGEKVIFTNGCFDILHRGHVQYLSESAALGDRLIIGINSDASVKSLEKGSGRPIQDEQSRAIIIAAMQFVDAVILFNDATPINLIERILPDVLAKGGDYDNNITDKSNEKYIVGSDVVKKNGGNVEVISFVDGFSTSKIEEKIRLH